MSVMQALNQTTLNPTSLRCTADGRLIVVGNGEGGAGGDASEATLIAIRDRLPAALVGGRLAVSIEEPLDVNLITVGILDVNVTSTVLANDAASDTAIINLNNDLGNTGDTAATADSGSWSLIALMKRLLSVTLAKGQQLMANSLPVTIASNQPALPTTDANLGEAGDAAATTNTGTFSLIALFKRLLDVTLARGQQTSENSLPVVLASDQTSIAFNATGIGDPTDTAATTDIGTFSLISLMKRLLSVTLLKGLRPQAEGLSVTPSIAFNEGAPTADTTRAVVSATSIVGTAIGAADQTVSNDTISGSRSLVQLLKRLLFRSYSGLASQVQITISTFGSNTDLLAANPDRKACSILYLHTSGSAENFVSVVDVGGGGTIVNLFQGDYYEFPIAYTGALQCAKVSPSGADPIIRVTSYS